MLSCRVVYPLIQRLTLGLAAGSCGSDCFPPPISLLGCLLKGQEPDSPSVTSHEQPSINNSYRTVNYARSVLLHRQAAQRLTAFTPPSNRESSRSDHHPQPIAHGVGQRKIASAVSALVGLMVTDVVSPRCVQATTSALL
jgi:hypothetical protein